MPGDLPRLSFTQTGKSIRRTTMTEEVHPRVISSVRIIMSLNETTGEGRPMLCTVTVDRGQTAYGTLRAML